MFSASDQPKKVGNACNFCKQRRRKCDGKKPMCGTCSRYSRDCIYDPGADGRKRKQPKDGVNAELRDLQDQIKMMHTILEDVKSHRLSTADIDRRLKSLETFGSTDVDVSSELLDSGDIHSESPDPTPVTDEGEVDSANFSSSNEAMDEISSMIWRLHIGEKGEQSFWGPSGNLNFTATQDKNLESERSKLNALAFVPRIDPYLLGEEIRVHLASLFLEHVNTFHQFVQYKTPDFARSYPGPDLCLNLLHSSIFAMGSIYSKRPGMEAVRESMLEFVESVVLKGCRLDPSPAIIQTMSILSCLELGRGLEMMGWMFNSMAGGLVLHLGLHVKRLVTEKISTSPTDRAQMQTFWASTLVDRISTSITGRSCVIPWRRVRSLPYREYMSSEQKIDVDQVAFDHQCRLWQIYDQYMDQIYSFDFEAKNFIERNELLVEARRDLANFFDTIEDIVFIRRSPDAKTVILLHMSYYMSLILIHRPYLREDTSTVSWRLSIRTSLTAAGSVTRLIRLYRKSHSFAQAPFFAIHNILTALTTHLFMATSSSKTMQTRAAAHVKVCTAALEELSVIFPQAVKALKSIRQLAYKWKVVAVLPIHLSNVVPSMTTKLSTEDRLLAESESYKDADIEHAQPIGSLCDEGLEQSALNEGPIDMEDILLAEGQEQGGLDWLFYEDIQNQIFAAPE